MIGASAGATLTLWAIAAVVLPVLVALARSRFPIVWRAVSGDLTYWAKFSAPELVALPDTSALVAQAHEKIHEKWEETMASMPSIEEMEEVIGHMPTMQE